MTRGRQKRWVVRAGDGATVGEIVTKAREPESAIGEGRVFIGRVRAKSSADAVKPGDEVVIGSGGGSADRASKVGTSTAVAEWTTIWARDGLLACAKPAGIPTVPDHGGASHSLVALAAESIGRKSTDLFVTSRLDREVSGVVVFATTPEAEARLKLAREQGRYARRYVAIASMSSASSTSSMSSVSSTLINVDQGAWDAPIGAGKDPRHRAAHGPDAKPSLTRWSVVARAGGFAMLAVEPQTGRTHQIRVHASHAGAPLLGDRDYGGPSRLTLPDGRVVALARIALHAARVTVPDARGEPLVAEAPVPDALKAAWTALGGADGSWNDAVSRGL
ncbi:MAG: Ribosomal large subunit pseudouridine synthase [Labilithrix sp.]|nr:Ribosomal large subunit pseudouridine synthase [Labilithrix sp.]